MEKSSEADHDRFLGIYLNDQLAAGVLWRELARRARANNEGTDFEEPLAQVATAIAEDVATFERLMDRLGVRRGRAKPMLAVAAEWVGRFKLNGRLTGFSPLSRFVELEALAMGIEGKKVLWNTLGELADLRSRVPDVDFDQLLARAEEQRARLEPLRVKAGRVALTREERHPSSPAPLQPPVSG